MAISAFDKYILKGATLKSAKKYIFIPEEGIKVKKSATFILLLTIFFAFFTSICSSITLTENQHQIHDRNEDLPLVTETEINGIVAKYISSVKVEPLIADKDRMRPSYEVVHMYTKKMLTPSESHKRTLAFEFLKEMNKNGTRVQIADEQTWHDLEIFMSEKSLAQNICRAQTEMGKVFFWRQIATPSVDESLLKQQEKMLSEACQLDFSERIMPLLKKLTIYESAVCGLWDQRDIHYIYLNLIKPKIVAWLPIVRLHPWSRKVDESLSDKHRWQTLSLVVRRLIPLLVSLYGLVQLGPIGISLAGISAAQEGINKLENLLNCFSPSAKDELLFSFYLQAGLQLRLKHLAGYLAVVKEIQIVLENSKTASIKKYCGLLDVTKGQALQELEALLEEPAFATEDLEHPEASLRNLLTAFNGRVLAAAEKLKACKVDLIPVMAAIGRLDAAMAIAQLLKPNEGFTRAEFDFNSRKPYIALEEYWHPGIVTGTPVRNTLSIGNNNPANIIVSGPNKGGKSANTEMIPICCLLAQSIGIVPAHTFKATPFSTIQVFRNIKDNRLTGDSRFQAELKRAIALFERARSHSPKRFSLTYLDELYTGTAPLEGATAAYVQLCKFGELPNSITLTTTHYPDMQKLARNKPDVFMNYMVTVRRENGRLTYPYTLVSGFSEDCTAFELAETLNANPAFVAECRKSMAHRRVNQRRERFSAIFRRLDGVVAGADLSIPEEILDAIFPLTRSSLEMVMPDNTHRDLSVEENNCLIEAINEICSRSHNLLQAAACSQNTNHKANYILWCLWHNYGASELSPATMVTIAKRAFLSDNSTVRAGAAYSLGTFFQELPERENDDDFNRDKLEEANRLFSYAAEEDTWEGVASKLALAKLPKNGKRISQTNEQKKLFQYISEKSSTNRAAASEASFYLGLIEKQNSNLPSAVDHFRKALVDNVLPARIEGLIRYELGLLVDDKSEKEIHLRKACELLDDEKKTIECENLLHNLFEKQVVAERELPSLSKQKTASAANNNEKQSSQSSSLANYQNGSDSQYGCFYGIQNIGANVVLGVVGSIIWLPQTLWSCLGSYLGTAGRDNKLKKD